MQLHPHLGGLQHRLNTDQTNPTLEPGGLSNGDSPAAQLHQDAIDVHDRAANLHDQIAAEHPDQAATHRLKADQERARAQYNREAADRQFTAARTEAPW